MDRFTYYTLDYFEAQDLSSAARLEQLFATYRWGQGLGGVQVYSAQLVCWGGGFGRAGVQGCHVDQVAVCMLRRCTAPLLPAGRCWQGAGPGGCHKLVQPPAWGRLSSCWQRQDAGGPR
jgi:hypothetical protein